jgi:metal-responsive CopG/Arc/MetJ family transcriptional regulator
MATEWVTVKLPRDLVNHIDRFVGKRGWSSRTDVVSQAIRDFLEDQKR